MKWYTIYYRIIHFVLYLYLDVVFFDLLDKSLAPSSLELERKGCSEKGEKSCSICLS